MKGPNGGGKVEGPTSPSARSFPQQWGDADTEACLQILISTPPPPPPASQAKVCGMGTSGPEGALGPGSLPLCPARGLTGCPGPRARLPLLLTQAPLASSAFLPSPLNGAIEPLCRGRLGHRPHPQPEPSLCCGLCSQGQQRPWGQSESALAATASLGVSGTRDNDPR